jgi:LDH2 family malate/lactate/ureidoglycolate dehydrogenase
VTAARESDTRTRESYTPGRGSDTVRVGVDELRSFLEGAFTGVGLDADEAALLADALTEAELTGNPTHGVMRLRGYLAGIREGRYSRTAPSVSPVSASLVLVDGHGALGYRPTRVAVGEAVRCARETGVGVAAVRAVAEFGRVAYYVREAARLGCVAVVCQNTQPLLGAPDATQATHGNNPLGFSAPGADAPVFDAAWTPRSGGELGRRAILGEPIPLAWGYVGPSGEPTTDPAEAVRGVHPAVGGAKGFGMSVLVDLLAGVLSGAESGLEPQPGEAAVGAFVLALDPAAFGTAERVPAALATSAAAVRGAGGRWPGDRARTARTHHLDTGFVDIPTRIWNPAVSAAQEGR